jgi:hypothetical protein
MKRLSLLLPLQPFAKEAVARTALFAACLCLVPLAASAAEKGRARSTVAKNERGAKAEAKAERPDRDDRRAEAPAADKSNAAAAPRATKPRVYDFGGLEVEGKLKTPQLLYFRGRVKQELDTSGPEKRSFMKELEKSADGKGL